jgi:thioredoxin domain-containing protein 10
MWHGNPVLTAVLFGLPLGFLTLICYSICCSDIMDADDDEEEGNFLKSSFVLCRD